MKELFIALSLIDDPRFGEGGDPGVCEIFYNTTGGSEIEPASLTNSNFGSDNCTP